MSSPSFVIVAQKFDQFGNPLPIQKLMQDSTGNYMIPEIDTNQTVNLIGVLNGTDHTTTYTQWSGSINSSSLMNLGYARGESSPLILQPSNSGQSGFLQLQLYPNSGAAPTLVQATFSIAAPAVTVYNQSNCGQTIALYNNSPAFIDVAHLQAGFSIKFVAVGAGPYLIETSSPVIRGFLPGTLTSQVTLAADGDMVEFNYDPNNNILQVVDKSITFVNPGLPYLEYNNMQGSQPASATSGSLANVGLVAVNENNSSKLVYSVGHNFPYAPQLISMSAFTGPIQQHPAGNVTIVGNNTIYTPATSGLYQFQFDLMFENFNNIDSNNAYINIAIASLDGTFLVEKDVSLKMTQHPTIQQSYSAQTNIESFSASLLGNIQYSIVVTLVDNLNAGYGAEVSMLDSSLFKVIQLGQAGTISF